MTEEQIQILAKAEGDEGVAKVLQKVNDENPVSMSELSEAVKQPPEKIMENAWDFIAKAQKADGRFDLTVIPKEEIGGEEFLTDEGVVIVRGMLQKLASRMNSFSKEMIQGQSTGADAINQWGRMKTDLIALMKLHKFTANTRSFKLRVPYSIPIPKEMGGGEMVNPTDLRHKATSNRRSIPFKEMDRIQQGLINNDPKAKQEALRFATALDLAGGEVSKIVDISHNVKGIVANTMLKMMYNSMLSSPTTHVVNMTSNAMNVYLRPTAALMGGDAKQKRQAIAAMYGATRSISEAWSLAARTL